MGISVSKVGKIANKLTGASSAASKSYKYSQGLAEINNAYQKEAAQNAHQWEMADLEKAGLNPALTATGGSGASLSGGGGGSAGGGGGGISPIDILNTIVNMQNQTSATESQIQLNDAEGKATLINALANWENANTNLDKANGGWIGGILGTDIRKHSKQKYLKWQNSEEAKRMKKAKNPKEAWINILELDQ